MTSRPNVTIKFRKDDSSCLKVLDPKMAHVEMKHVAASNETNSGSPYQSSLGFFSLGNGMPSW